MTYRNEISTRFNTVFNKLKGEGRIRSKRHFADLISVSEATIRHYLRGDITPGAETVAKVCEVFDIDPSWLLLGGKRCPKKAKQDLTIKIQIEVL